MGTKIWEITFGVNTDSIKLVATSLEEALEKAKKRYADAMKEAPDAYWISSVELIAESDD